MLSGNNQKTNLKRKYMSVLNQKFMYKVGIVVDRTEDGIYIEEVTENQEINGYEMICDDDDILEWFDKTNTREWCQDYYDPRDEYGHGQNSGTMSDDEVIEYVVSDEPKLLKEFALYNREKWVKLDDE
jgi:hypothetical protein